MTNGCIDKCFLEDVGNIVVKRAEQLSMGDEITPRHYTQAIRDIAEKLTKLGERSPESFEGRYSVEVRQYER